MSYRQTGDTVTDILSGAQAAAQIASDPALPEVAGLIGELHASIQVPGQPETPGIGLGGLVLPLKVYVEYNHNPWIVGPLLLAGIIGIPFALGYMFAKGRK